MAAGRDGGQSADGAEQAYQLRMEQLKARLKHLLDTQNEQHAVAEQTRGIAEQIARELSDAATDLSAKRDALAAWEDAFRETAPEGQTVEQLLDGASRERTELAFRLRTQAENRGKVSGLQKVLDKRRTESERWAKLNDLVGSADGAKFRRIAQGYTLDVLLGDANVQLRALSRRFLPATAPDARQHGCLIEEFALYHATGQLHVVILQEENLAHELRHGGHFDDVFDQILTRFVVRVSLSGEDELYRTLRIVDDFIQSVKIRKEQVCPFVGGETAGKADRQYIRIQ